MAAEYISEEEYGEGVVVKVVRATTPADIPAIFWCSNCQKNRPTAGSWTWECYDSTYRFCARCRTDATPPPA